MTLSGPQSCVAVFAAAADRLSDGRRQVCTALACLVCLLFVSRERLAAAHLWAEDGAIFFADALASGFASVLQPYAGYYQLVPRLVTTLGALLPITTFALLQQTVCIMIYAGVASVFSRQAYAWLVPSPLVRVLICLTWCLLPGLEESLGNMANLHTPLFMYLGLLLWRDLHVPLRPAQFLFSGLAMGSEGGAVVLAPVVIVRMLLCWRRFPGGAARDIVFLAMLLAGTLAHRHATAQAVRSGALAVVMPDMWAVATRFLAQALERYALFPVLGRDFIGSIRRHDAWRVWFFGIPLLGSCAALLVYRFRRLSWHVFAVPVCIMSIYLLTWVVRAGSLELAAWQRMNTRYALATAPFALICWASAAYALRPAMRLRVAYLFLLLHVALEWHWRDLHPFEGHETDWARTARAIEAIRRQPTCGLGHVPHNPQGWSIPVRCIEPPE